MLVGSVLGSLNNASAYLCKDLKRGHVFLDLVFPLFDVLVRVSKQLQALTGGKQNWLIVCPVKLSERLVMIALWRS